MHLPAKCTNRAWCVNNGELCGKGFRDDRKMKLHMARHNSGLSHKCHLCPRSFEGPKPLSKHIKAHEMGRYVASISDPVKVKETALETTQATVLAPVPPVTLTPVVVTPAPALMAPVAPDHGLTFPIQYPGTVPAATPSVPPLPQQPDPSVMSVEDTEASTDEC